MVENNQCIQLAQGPWVPCRGTKEFPSQFFPDRFGRCPFIQCIALKVISDPELLKRVVPAEDQKEAREQGKEWIIRMMVFHAICPGDHNPSANENIIDQYSVTDPVHPNHK